MAATVPTWDESYETGDNVIDTQHRLLLALIDDLDRPKVEASDKDVVAMVLDHAMDFTFSHFDIEEDLMVRVEYPSADQLEMIHQHREFRSYARIRVLEFRAGDLPSVLPLKAWLKEWLIHHEFGLDKKLAAFIRQQQAMAHGPRT